MLLRRSLVISLFFLIYVGLASSDSIILSNGTGIYLTTGDSYRLYQGYILNLKSVSSDGSIWLQLTSDNKTVKSEIVHDFENFTYIKNNRTILSVKVDKVYSGSSEKSLVSLSLYQFADPEMPVPNRTGITPVDTQSPGNNSPSPRVRPPLEPVIWILGIGLIISLFYILRKLW